MLLAETMVGRDDELERLMSSLGRSFSAEGSLVLVCGEVGSGKTTLCNEFERLAISTGCQVMIGRCIPGSQSPYLPFMEAFFDHSPNPFAAANSASIESVGMLMLSVLEGLERLSNDRAVVLRLEDLHWADSASISLMHFLARNVRTMKVLLVGTYRPEDLHTGPSGVMHPLKESLRIMRREGVCHELELRSLGPGDTRRMVPFRLGGCANEALLDLVVAESKGNPLFAVEMLRFLVDSGQARCEEGMWRLVRDVHLQIPSTVREVIVARTEKVPREAKRVIDCASVIGEWFDPDLIREGLGLDRMHLLDELETLEQEFHLVINEEGVYRFSHEKIRQVVYEEISVPRRRELHNLIGQALERGLPDDELLGPLSHHFDKAGQRERCIRYSLAAGKYCQRRKAVKEAKEYYHLVLERSQDDRGEVAARLEALEGLGDLRYDVSTMKEWQSYYEQFLALNQDRRARARVLTKAAECWDQVALADVNKAVSLLDEAESISDGDLWVLSTVEYRRAELCVNDGRTEEAMLHLSRARAYFGEMKDPGGGLRCQILEIYCLHQKYRYQDAVRLEEELLVAARDLGDLELLFEVEGLQVCISARMGETDLAKQMAAEVISSSYKMGMMWWWRWALHYRAWALELEGDLGSARDDISAAWVNAKESEVPFLEALFGIELGLYESWLGNLAAAEFHYEEAARTSSRFEFRLRSKLDSNLTMLKAELLAGIGATMQSEELYELMIKGKRESGKLYELVNCHSRYGMSLAKRGRTEKARPHFEQAMEVAKRIGCEKRVLSFSKRAGISLLPSGP